MPPRTAKPSATVSRHELAQTIKRNLLPQSFPLRREIEFAAVIGNDIEGTCYYDTFWLDAYTVAIAVFHIPTGGLEGAMEATALKAVFQAALTRSRHPAAALEVCQDIEAFGNIHAAAILIDLHTGATIASKHGQGQLFFGDGAPAPTGEFTLAQGTSLCLSVGVFQAAPAPSLPMPDTSALDLAQQVLHDTHGAATVATVSYKQALHPPGAETATFANEIAEIPRALDWLERFCESHMIEPQTVAGIDLALDEILTNVISYAFRDNASHTIDIEARAADDELCIEIRDNGISFNPLKTPTPALDTDIEKRKVGGLGLHFVKTIADTVTYHRERGWNILCLCKRTDQADRQ